MEWMSDSLFLLRRWCVHVYVFDADDRRRADASIEARGGGDGTPIKIALCLLAGHTAAHLSCIDELCLAVTASPDSLSQQRRCLCGENGARQTLGRLVGPDASSSALVHEKPESSSPSGDAGYFANQKNRAAS